MALFLCSGAAFSQEVEKEPVAVVEFGIAAGSNLKDGGSSIGTTVAVELTPIENWLEVEAVVKPDLHPSLQPSEGEERAKLVLLACCTQEARTRRTVVCCPAGRATSPHPVFGILSLVILYGLSIGHDLN